MGAELEYRLNFAMAAATSLGNFVGNIFALSLLFRHMDNFEGWRWQESLLVMGLFTVLEGVTATLLSPNLSRIVLHVQKGTLDFILLKPMDTQAWLSLRNISPWGLPNVFFGMLLVIYAGWKLGLGPEQWATGTVSFGMSLVILYSLWFFLSSMTIWFVKISNITEVLHGITEAGRYPIAAYPAAWRFFFTFVIPVAFMTTVPAEAALRRRGVGNWMIAELVLAVGLFMFSRWFWRVAMRSYTSASS